MFHSKFIKLKMILSSTFLKINLYEINLDIAKTKSGEPKLKNYTYLNIYSL